MDVISYAVPPQAAGSRLNVFLRMQGVSAQTIKRIKYQGLGFFADGVPVHTNYCVQSGETISFSLPPECPSAVLPQPIPFTIRYEDAYAVVLDKPAGVAVHPTLNAPEGTLANGWMYHLRQQGKTGVFRPVNRIDKNTSGLVLCAQNAFAAPMLAQTTTKRYLAVVQGVLTPGRGTVEAPIARQEGSIIGRCVGVNGKPSCTRYTTLATGSGVSLICCETVTGRTHQIRVHMAYLGHPLLGDSLYGGCMDAIGRQALHCAAIGFVHPVTGQRICVQSPLPPDMACLCHQMNTAPETVMELAAKDLFH